MESNITPLRPVEPPMRTPPYNTEAEQALLGAILVNNSAYGRVSEFLLPEHFGNAVHGRIYAATAKLIERGDPATPITLKNLFDQDGALAEIGGSQYLGRLAASAVTIIGAESYGRSIRDLHLRRQLIAIGEDVVNDAFDHDLDKPATDQIETAEQKLFELATDGQDGGGFSDFDANLGAAIARAEAAFKRDGKIVGVPTGFTDIDKKLGGLHPSDLVILAGRPSMGKTSLATNIAFNAASRYRARRGADGRVIVEDGAVVGFFSLEMSAEQLTSRVLGEQVGISPDRMRRGELTHDDFTTFQDARSRIGSMPLFIDDTPGITIQAMRARARRLKRRHGLGMIVIDYLQLMRLPGRSRESNRVQEVSEITRGLKILAKELNVPVLALSQLSREVERRDPPRPMLADLRESGSIEQDADVVMFIFREEYYLQRAEPARRADEGDDKFNDRYARWQDRWEQTHAIAEIIIGKQRHGPTGTERLRFDAELTKFSNYTDRGP